MAPTYRNNSRRLLITCSLILSWMLVSDVCAQSEDPVIDNRGSSRSTTFAEQFAKAYERDWDRPSSIESSATKMQDAESLEQVQDLESQNHDLAELEILEDTQLLDPSLSQPSGTIAPIHQAKNGSSKSPANSKFQTEQDLQEQTPIGDIWWSQAVAAPFEAEHATESVDVNSLLYTALQNSQQIQFISKDPLIRELEIVEAEAEFDPATFARSVYDDRVDPVGNSLTTGGAPFLKDNIWSAEAGIRKKLRTGGQLELEQSLGFQNSNSRFFVPQDQGTATLSLNYNQPLLRGAGHQYNRSQILLAQQTTDLAWDTFSANLQDELLSVVEAYWDLYFRRAVFLQKQRNVQRGEAILRKIEGRAGLDSLPSQIARARSEVQSRRTALANTFRDVRNAETEIRRLVSDPDWLGKQSVEMLPTEPPITHGTKQTLKTVVYDAIQNRPEIRAAVQKAKLASLQTSILTNELLPELTLLFNSYFSALDGDTGIEKAFQQQFSADPGISIGLEFEFPYKNRAARSRHTRSKIQLSKIHHEIQQTTQNVIAEAQIAYRRVISASETLEAASAAVAAARIDLNQNHRRWQNFALIEGDIAEGQTPTLVLDQLLDSQQRLADAEFTYSQSLKELKVAEIGLRRASGTLLLAEEIQVSKINGGDQPTLLFDRPQNNVEPNYELPSTDQRAFDYFAPASNQTFNSRRNSTDQDSPSIQTSAGGSQ